MSEADMSVRKEERKGTEAAEARPYSDDCGARGDAHAEANGLASRLIHVDHRFRTDDVPPFEDKLNR